MPEYIRKDAVLFLTTEAVAWELQDKIEALPVADVQPVRHGKWVHNDRPTVGNPYGGYICSLCCNIVDYKENYCSRCGADMRDAENDNP